MLTTVYEIRTLNTHQFLRVALAGAPEAQVVGGEVGQSYSLGGWDRHNVAVSIRRGWILEYRQVVRRIDDEVVRNRLLADSDDILAELDRQASERRDQLMEQRNAIEVRKADAAGCSANHSWNGLSSLQQANARGVGG